MFLLKLAIVLVVPSTTWCRLVKDVCSGSQWEAVQATVLGKYSNGVRNFTRNIIQISYDFNNTRLFTSTNTAIHGQIAEVRKIYDYNMDTLYTITLQTCNKTRLDKPFRKACVPNDANYSWDMTHYGINHDNMILVWEYRGSQDGVNYNIHTLFDGNPVMEQTYGDVDGVSFFSNTFFHNMTAGIKNPDVFTPPSSCKGVDYEPPEVPVPEMFGFVSF